MDETEVPRRTPHGKWAAGALVLLAAIVAAALWTPRPPPPAPTAFPEAEPLHIQPTGRAGRVVCGFCNGDGRIDAVDLRRQAPRLGVAEGPCGACAGQGGR